MHYTDAKAREVALELLSVYTHIEGNYNKIVNSVKYIYR